MFDLFLDTLQALLQPRRLVPILIVAVPMVVAQHAFSRDPNADALALVMVMLFVALGPFAYRLLFQDLGFRRSLRRRGLTSPGPWLRLLGFGLLGGVPALFGLVTPRVLGLHSTFLTDPLNLGIVASLFWVGSWGLARDVQQEVSLVAAHARAERLATEAEHARLLALDAHLDPHFLFNTLNAIAEWVQQDPAFAERALLDLSAVLREILEGVKAPTWSLARELDLVQAVWSLHAVRDPERFAADIDLPDPPPDLQVPPLVLLPLAENAVTHGAAKGHRGRLGLRVRPEQGGARIELRNPGGYAGPREGSEGVPTVRRRLALQYGDRATLTLSDQGDHTCATVFLPGASP